MESLLGNILIVDDDATNRKLLRVTLEQEGQRVFEAEDGAQALALLLERGPVEGIISDVLMPRLDGYGLCYEIRKSQRLREIPFIIYTQTFSSPSDEDFARQVGADRYFRKPTATSVLLEALRQIVAERRSGAQVVSRPLEELIVVREYNQVLVRKLEEKNRELERELALREQRLLAFFSAATAGMAILDADLRF